MSATASLQARRWTRILRVATSSTVLATLAVACFITMNELDRLIADVVSPAGRAHSFVGVFGFTSLAETEAWGDWARSEYPIGRLLLTHTVVDLVFIACFGSLFWRMIRRLDAENPGRPRGRRVLVALIALDLIEDVLLAVLAAPLVHDHAAAAPPAALASLQAWTSVAKWAALVIFAIIVLFSGRTGERARAVLVRARQGLYAQRLVAIVVAAIAVVSIVGADGVIEQMPDVYRSWVRIDGLDWVPMSWSFGAFAITGLGLWWLARGRARRYFASAVDERPPARLLPWLLTATAAAVLGAVLSGPHNTGWADWVPLGVFVGALLLIPAVSRALRKSAHVEPLREPDVRALAPTARRVGDALVTVWVAIAFLGPFKALLAPLALGAIGDYDETGFDGSFPRVLWLAGVFLVLALVLPEAFRRAAARVPSSEPRSVLTVALLPSDVDEGQQRRLNALGLMVLSVSSAAVIAFLLFPMWLGAELGASAVVILLVGAWAGILGWLTLTLGRYRPLEVFAALRLRSAPVVTLLIVLPLVASAVQSSPSLHAVRFGSDAPMGVRPSLETAYGDWYASPTCTIQVGPHRVKPLVLVAAEGGGIRAATWTVDVLRMLPGTDDVPAVPGSHACAASAVFASTGASGGSVGLATFPRGVDLDHDRATIAGHHTGSITGDDALGADLAGLLAGDLVGAVSGIRVPSSGVPHTEGWMWRDRTALQETTWERQLPQFAQPFDSAPSAPTGYLVMGSTDATSLCKVLVSQLNMSPSGWTQTDPGTGAQSAAAPNCGSRHSEFASTIDLIEYLGTCDRGLTWGTAAELSARFPFVSPGGRISPATLPSGCREVADLQLVDGGSTDNSALGTWVDAAPSLTAFIRATNAAADGAERPFVVPILLFATNETGTDVVVVPDGSRPEAAVPLAAIFSAKAPQTSPSAWLHRASEAYARACPATSGACDAALRTLRNELPGGIVVASPSTTPAVSVPLGWSLSEFSRSRLRFEAIGQALCGRRDTSHIPEHVVTAHAGDPCRASGEYGQFGRLLELFDDAVATPVSPRTE